MTAIKLRIRELRQQRDMTLAELSKLADMSAPHLSDLETGKKRFNATNLAALAKALEVPPSALLDDGPNNLQARIHALPAEDFNVIMRTLEALEQTRPED